MLDSLTYSELYNWELYYQDHLFSDDFNNLLNAYNIYYTVLGYVDPEKAKDIKVEQFLINPPKKQTHKPEHQPVQQTSEEMFEICKLYNQYSNRE